MTKQTFEQYVDTWDGIVVKRQQIAAKISELTAHLTNQLRDLNEQEIEMRKAIVEAVRVATPDFKEGTNRHVLADGRTLKLVNKIDRTIEVEEIANTRAAYVELGDAATVDFDALLRKKYELDKATWNKLGDKAKAVVAPMIVSKPAAPTVAFD